jgi:hypothetical protein
MAAGIVAAAAAVAARRQRILDASASLSWYAGFRGMRFTDPVLGWAHEVSPRVDGVVDGVPVSLQLGTDAFYTVALALPVGALRGNLEVTREGVVAKLTKLFGAQDIQLGDPRFDPRYLVQATADSFPHTVLTDSIRAELLALDAESLSYDDGTQQGHRPIVALALPGVRHAAETLDAALRLVVEVAQTRDASEPYR